MAVTPVENETYKVKAVLESMPIYTASAITAPIWVGDKIDALLRGVERSKEATLSELEYGLALRPILLIIMKGLAWRREKRTASKCFLGRNLPERPNVLRTW